MLRWFINASAFRSDSKRATNCCVSIGNLICLTATMWRTGNAVAHDEHSSNFAARQAELTTTNRLLRRADSDGDGATEEGTETEQGDHHVRAHSIPHGRFDSDARGALGETLAAG